jgi:hypothetical protein
MARRMRATARVMKARDVGVVLVSAIFGLASMAASGRQDWEAANAATVRLRPSSFQDLPAVVRDYLERRRCTIAQSFYDKAPHNIVRGRFTSAARTDIAVLCSVDRVSTVLVFRGGGISEVSELARHPDEQFLQVVNPGVIGYSRALGVADPDYIRQRHAAYGGPMPPPLDHDGINDVFVEKASVVWYWHEGKWLQLQSAD